MIYADGTSGGLEMGGFWLEGRSRRACDISCKRGNALAD